MAKNSRQSRKNSETKSNKEPTTDPALKLENDSGVAADGLPDSTKISNANLTGNQGDLLVAVKSLTSAIEALTSALKDAKSSSPFVATGESAVFSYVSDLTAAKAPDNAGLSLTAAEASLAWVGAANAPRINIAWELSRFFNDPNIQPNTPLSKYGVGGPGTIPALGARLAAWPAFAPYRIVPDSNALAWCFYVSNLVDYLASLLLRAGASA